MREVIGDLWHYWNMPSFIVCITTNGDINRRGDLVMGQGCAKEAAEKFPGLANALGSAVVRCGNIPIEVTNINLLTFPVKYHWNEDASLVLIANSARILDGKARNHPEVTFVLPRPGCGNGRLEWTDVEPILSNLPDNVLVISKR